tara:strand:+ start:1000 stop:3012 length:2013 start_codon:yes stop_codon:yes gene_type:complete
MNNQNSPKNNDAQRIGVQIKDKISEIEASIQGIKAGEMAQEKEGLPEEWIRDGEVENRIRDYIQRKHTFTSDDVWEELLDPLIRNGEIPPVDNRRIIGPMFKRLVDDGLAIDSEYAIRSKRRNGALMRVYRIPNSARSKFLREQFIANPDENITLKKSSEDLKKSMEIEAEQIKKLEKQLDDARRRQQQDENLRNRFKESGYNRHGRRVMDSLDERLSRENFQYYPPLKANTATPIEVDGNTYQVYLFDELGATGEKINYPSSLEIENMLNISLIVKNQNDESIGEIVLQLEDRAGGMGYSLMSDSYSVSNHVSGQPIGYRAVGYSNSLPSNQYLMNQIAQKYIPLLGKKLIEGNDYSGFVNDTLKFLPYDENMIRFNDYIMNFVMREEFEDLFEATSYDELVERNIMKNDTADAYLIEKLNEFEAEKTLEGKMEKTSIRGTYYDYIITPAFYNGLDSSDKSILKTLIDWINGKDPVRAEMAERQLINVLEDMDKRYNYPNWAFVSSGLLDMISEEDWYEQALSEAYAKEGEEQVNDLLDTDLIQTLMDTPTGEEKIRKEWDNLISNMASRSAPFPEENDAWETRTDDSAIEAKMRDLKGISNLNMGNLNRRYLKTYYRNINGRRFVATRPIRNPKPIAKLFRNNGYNARIIPTAEGKRIYLAKKRYRVR